MNSNFKKQNIKEANAKFIKLVEANKNNELVTIEGYDGPQDPRYVAIQELDAFVGKYAKKFAGQAEIGDLMQEGRLAILEHFDEYDPFQTMPTTFFAVHILSRLNKCSNASKPSSDHYLQKLKRARQICEDHNLGDIQNANPIEIAELSKEYRGVPIAVKTIKEIQDELRLNGGNLAPSSLDASEEYYITDYVTPETAIEEQELKKEINDAINTLTPMEQYITRRRCNFIAAWDEDQQQYEDKVTSQKIADELNRMPEVVKREMGIAADKIITAPTINTKYGRAKNKLAAILGNHQELRTKDSEEITLLKSSQLQTDLMDIQNDIYSILDAKIEEQNIEEFEELPKEAIVDELIDAIINDDLALLSKDNYNICKKAMKAVKDGEITVFELKNYILNLLDKNKEKDNHNSAA